ncbi:MAG: signal recognition particle-docking protein FtsY [Lachnospiraceae bacterium]|jgi:fused signal recognition particle receptor|nr:signal recognition particle-docking protein FtsY [Lachnospiraceae bacterium]
MEQEKKSGFFGRLLSGLSKTRKNIASGLSGLFSSKLDDDFYEELEEILVMADIGMQASEDIITELRAKVKEQGLKEPGEVRQLLIDIIAGQMNVDEHAYDYEDNGGVVMVIGVNGVGKTTSIGKLAALLRDKGRKVILAAADTFRAGAIDQLAEWSDRAGAVLISQSEGSDPAAVVFDALGAAKARKADILMIDTAGRLHNKKNLMDELAKINRVTDREMAGVRRETFIVLDATTGQNALVQAKQFSEVAPVTGIILTKLDGTAKGGIAIAIAKELSIPVKYIGVGEKLGDLQRFNPREFAEALFDDTETAEE